MPFYLGLMAHLARHGIPCPAPIADLSDRYLSELNGKPAALVTRLPGRLDRALGGRALCRARRAARAHASRRAFVRRISREPARDEVVAQRGERGASAARAQRAGVARRGAALSVAAPLSRRTTRTGARRLVQGQCALRAGALVGRDRFLLRRRRLPDLRCGRVRERLVPRRSAARSAPRSGANDRTARCVSDAAAAERARA